MLFSFLYVVAKSAHGGLIKKWGYTMTWIPFACHDYLINRVIISLKKAIELRQSLFLRSIGPFFFVVVVVEKCCPSVLFSFSLF